LEHNWQVCRDELCLFNFIILETHCQRNIGMCPICKEPFPKSDMESHMATEPLQFLCLYYLLMEKVGGSLLPPELCWVLPGSGLRPKLQGLF
uniref:Uncharacterized protein n=1 Tax=Neovison vison TaxID=452646 RepID=A0A8C7BGV7_NEOVI